MEYDENFFAGMNDWREVYEVSESVHGRIWGEIAQSADRFLKEKEVYIFVRNIGKGREIFDASSVFSLAANLIGDPKGSRVEIIAKGKLETDILKNCAEEVAKVFCKMN